VSRRVALVHDWLTGMRGGEKVLEQLAAPFPDAPIYTLFHFSGRVSAALESHRIETSFLQGAPAIESRYRHYLPLFPLAIEEFDLSGYELILSSSHCVAKSVIPPPGALHVCYCHTPMRYAWDQEQAYFPRRAGLVAALRSLILARLRRWDVKTASRVHRYLANSRFVAERIRRYYRREAEVLHPPVDCDFFTPGEAGARGHCLMVAALAPYKRIEIAIAACGRLGLELVVVGFGPERERLERLAGPRARFVGTVPASRLRDLYRGAICLLQPGVEDFGIAAVEALACGTPVVALSEGGVLDIVEDAEHGVLYRSVGDDPEALSAAVDKVRGIQFNKLNLRARAESFSAARFSNRLRALLAELEPLSKSPSA